MNEVIEKVWKDFRYSYTKNPECILNNRELFDLFKAKINRVILDIESIEPF